MWLTSLSIKRPLLMLMVITTLLVVGFVSWSRLAVDLFPALDYPIVTITTVYPGAGPDAVDTLVTKKIEDTVAGMNDIDYMQSSSYEGVSSIFIVFTDRANKDSAIEAERRVNGIRGELPVDVRAPSVGKFNPNEQPVLVMSLSGNRDLGQLRRLAEDKVKKQIEAAAGVGQVTLIGGLEREIQVQVDQQKLQARGLSILQVNQALTGDNVNVPAGSLTERGRDWTVRLNNQAQTPQELNSVLVASTANGPVYLRDVATVIDTYKKVQTIQRTDGNPALGITVVKTSSANAIETVDGIKREVQRIERELPADVHIDVILDGSVFTRNSVRDVQQELSMAVVLTGLVLLLFLHTFRATAIVLLAIPTSLIATLGVVYFMGFSLNMMSLMGLTLTVGILVDDSIVVLENIFRHLQAGEEPSDAAINGRSEIGFAAIAITLVDIVVFTPIAFMGGFVGQWFREFGLVIATATLFSLFVSFTLTPLLASRWYRKGQRLEIDADTPTLNPLALFARAWDRGYERITRIYGHVLRGALRFRWLTVALGIASFVGGIMLVATGMLSSEFVPTTDDGRLVVNVEMPAGTTLDRTDAATRRVEERVLAWSEVERVSTSVGVGGGSAFLANQARFARIQVEMKDKSERTRTPKDLAAEARTFGRDIPDATVKASPSSFFENTAAPISIRVQGDNHQVLASLAGQVANVVRSVPGTADVSDGGVTGQPELVVSIDRERAADLGLSPGQVASVLRTGLAGSTVSSFRPEGTKGWDLTVILDPNERARGEQVTEIPIVTPRGSTIRLGQVANISTVSGPTQVDRRDRQRTVFVLAQLDGRPLGDVTTDIQSALASVQVPAGYTLKVGGDAEDQAESFGQIFSALGLSVLLMYMLMVALFESLLFPLVIMLSLPLAVIGAFGLLVITGNTLNMMSLIGMILLMGLVGKNAILLVDYTNTLRRQGMPRNEALMNAGPIRLRPILMTTSALVLAMMPIALAVGEGGEFRAPMAVTVIGGLITSTLLTLVMIPAVYTIMDDFQGLIMGIPSRVRNLLRRRAAAPAPSPVPEQRPPARAPIPVGGGSD